MDINQRQKENQLYEEIANYSTKFSFIYRLTEHERLEVIEETMLKLLEKERDGTIKLTPDYNYRGYLTFTLKNFLYRKFEHNNTHKEQFHKTYIDEQVYENQGLNEYEMDYNMSNFLDIEKDLEPMEAQEIRNEYKEVMKLLTPKERSCLRWRAKGWQIKDIAYGLGMVKGVVQHHLISAKKKIEAHLGYEVELNRKKALVKP